MRVNTIQKALKQGETVLCGWLHIPNTWTAEMMANADWDCLTVDMQHGLHSIETAIQMMQAIATTNTIPFARSKWNDPGQIMRLLDGGAYGIICPMINTKKECERFVGACRYPPLGYRSMGPTRAKLYAGNDYVKKANESILVFAMVETLEALNNINQICSVKGLDGVFIGSGDLKLSIEADKTEKTSFDNAVQQIITTSKQHNLFVGVWCDSVNNTLKMIEKGCQFIALKSDGKILMEHVDKETKQVRKQIKNRQ